LLSLGQPARLIAVINHKIDKARQLTMKVITTPPVPVAPVREFVFTEREALFVRDILGGSTRHKLIENALTGGFNLGKWNSDSGRDMYDSLLSSLDMNLRS